MRLQSGVLLGFCGITWSQGQQLSCVTRPSCSEMVPQNLLSLWVRLYLFILIPCVKISRTGLACFKRDLPRGAEQSWLLTVPVHFTQTGGFQEELFPSLPPLGRIVGVTRAQKWRGERKSCSTKPLWAASGTRNVLHWQAWCPRWANGGGGEIPIKKYPNQIKSSKPPSWT